MPTHLQTLTLCLFSLVQEFPTEYPQLATGECPQSIKLINIYIPFVSSLASRPKTGGFDVDYAKTPGPAGYGVHTPDLYGRKAPAYTILGRQFMPGGILTTIHYNNIQTNPFALAMINHLTCCLNFEFCTDGTKKPGPGAHSPEKCNSIKQKAPSYSLGVRHSEYMCPLIIDVAD